MRMHMIITDARATNDVINFKMADIVSFIYEKSFENCHIVLL